MNDLISRQAAIDEINNICPVDTEYDCTLLDRVDVRCVLLDLPSAQPEQRWIPASEMLPEEDVQVLVTDDAGGLATIDVDWGYFDKEYGRFEWFHSQNVTAWMPLPEPWKGEDDDSNRKMRVREG